jgi:hypothetical protein
MTVDGPGYEELGALYICGEGRPSMRDCVLRPLSAGFPSLLVFRL